MYLAVIAVEALVIVLLIMALLWGQPTALASERMQIASYRATLTAIPSPTHQPCRKPPYYTLAC